MGGVTDGAWRAFFFVVVVVGELDPIPCFHISISVCLIDDEVGTRPAARRSVYSLPIRTS